MSLERSLRRRRRATSPRVLARLFRGAAKLHCRQTGIPPEDRPAAIRSTVRLLERGELVIEIDQATDRFRIMPANSR